MTTRTTKVIGALVAFALSATIMINLSDNSSDGKANQIVTRLLLDRAENDQEVAKMFVTTKACKTEMPTTAEKVLNKYVAARGEELKPQLREARKLLNNPFMMVLGCKAIQGIVNSFDS